MPATTKPLTMSQAHSGDYLQGWNDCHAYMAEEVVRLDDRIEKLREGILAARREGCACDFHLYAQDEDLLTDEALDHYQTLEQQRNAAADDAAVPGGGEPVHVYPEHRQRQGGDEDPEEARPEQVGEVVGADAVLAQGLVDGGGGELAANHFADEKGVGTELAATTQILVGGGNLAGFGSEGPADGRHQQNDAADDERP